PADDVLRAHGAGDGVEVVARVERPAVIGTGAVERVRVEGAAAVRAFEVGEEGWHDERFHAAMPDPSPSPSPARRGVPEPAARSDNPWRRGNANNCPHRSLLFAPDHVYS